jgi:hypothetical protein
MRVQQLGAAFKSIYRVSVGEVILPRQIPWINARPEQVRRDAE